HLRHGGRARCGQGRLRRQAPGALRGRRPGRARLGGDRDSPGPRPGDRDPRPVRERGARVDEVSEQPRMDERGLVELDDSVMKAAKIDGSSAVIEARDMTIRKINAELRWLIYEQGITDLTGRDPGARHSLGVGILARCRLRFEGSLGYFGCGLIDGPEVEITGRVGWSVAENMMSGVVVVEGNAGSLAGAALRGGDLVVKGDVGARTGI